MKRHLPAFLLLACAASPPAPTAAPVTDLAATAAHDAGQWPQCAAMFEDLAERSAGASQVRSLYGAACCHARGGKPDRAFGLLERAVQGGMRNLEHVAQDPDLAPLHADPRWAPLLAGIERNVAAYEATLGDPALGRELLALAAEDQKARMTLFDDHGEPSQEELDALVALDARTTARMKEIVATHGWPGKRLVGEDAAHMAWLLVQHADADLAFQKRCLALLEQAVAAGDAEARDHAYLYDRVAVHEGRAQRYGTQFGPDGEPLPLEDPDAVDERRGAVGLGTMAEYKQQMRAAYGEAKP